jgi:hypothetical protein
VNVRGLYEAQAQVFEAAAWRAIEAVTGQSFSSFPDIQSARGALEFRLQNRVAGATEHDIGYRLLWAQALTGIPAEIPGGADLPGVLRSGNTLSSTEALAMYNFLVGMDPAGIEEWASALLARSDLMSEFMEIARSRLEPGLPLELVSNPAGYDHTWFAP